MTINDLDLLPLQELAKSLYHGKGTFYLRENEDEKILLELEIFIPDQDTFSMATLPTFLEASAIPLNLQLWEIGREMIKAMDKGIIKKYLTQND